MAICASLPSGCSSAAEARRRVCALLGEAGTLPFLDCVAEDRCPHLQHLNEGATRHKSNVIFVGSASQVVDISPWSMPLPSDTFEANACFLRSRADLRAFLWPLRNKVLVCDCGSKFSSCWGGLLVTLFSELFVTQGDVPYTVEPFAQDSTDSCSDYDYSDDELDYVLMIACLS